MEFKHLNKHIMTKKEYMKQWYSEHREKELAKKREKYYANREFYIAKVKSYHEQNKEKRINYMKSRYNTLHGRAMSIINNCNKDDRKANRPKGDLTVEWVEEQLQKGCTYKDKCGTTDWRLIGLNRKDNNLPHTKDNCEPCCWECNNRLHHIETSKPVDQISPINGEVIATFPSASEATKYFGCTGDRVSRVCRGERKTFKGYIWRYIQV